MIDITNIIYLAFRLAPFILVCFFTLESFLNWNLKGIIYLFGLLFACVTVTLCSVLVTPHTIPTTNNICNLITIGQNASYISQLPLSSAVFSFTLFYLLTFIINVGYAHAEASKAGVDHISKITAVSKSAAQNGPILALFPILIIIDSAWNTIYGCSNPANIVMAIVISGIIGVLWALIITSTKNPNLFYISNYVGDVCSRPTKTKFRCKPTTK